MPSEPQCESLPFEPKSKKSSDGKTSRTSAEPSSAAAPKRTKQKSSVKKSGRPNRFEQNDAGIPEVVSRRMLRRMAIFAGVPTFLGMSSFVVSYILLTQHIAEFPNVVVLLVSLGCFGLGTIGLSYGVLSASWQEEVPGSLLGMSEFSVNFRRLVQGLRKPKQPSTSD
ncbi:MAG: PAM68 family protein [Cyanobacteria bacterium P01_H01_bin.26]